MEAMQFGHALDRYLREILLADPKLGPVYLLKLDISDGFYRIDLAIDDIPKLGVVFPTWPGEEPLVAFPLVLPMGWKNSPPIFSAATETAADIANENLQNNVPAAHHSLDILAATMDVTALGTVSNPGTASNPACFPNNAPTIGTALNTTPTSIARDPFLPSGSSPIAYVDVFVDDFIGICQGEKNRQHVRRTLLHAVDSVFRPNDFHDDSFRRSH